MDQKLPPLNWLRAFESASRHLSFTDAARELHMTQSAVSQQIKSLENYLGRVFFIRKARSLELTTDAKNYLPTVEAAFKLLHEGTQGLLGVDHDQLLEIRANLAFTVFWLTPRLDDLFNQYSWINLNVATTLWESGPETPYASVEIRFGVDSSARLGLEPLMQDEIYPVCSPELADKITEPEELLNYRLIDCSGIIQSWDKWFSNLGMSLPKDKSIDKASTYVVTFNMAQSSQGIALGHNMIARDLILQGKLVRLFDHSIPMKEHYTLIPPTKRNANVASKAFHSWFNEQMELFLK